MNPKSDDSEYTYKTKCSTPAYLSVWIFQPLFPSADCLFPACAHPAHVHDPALDSGASLEVHSIASLSLHAGTDLVVNVQGRIITFSNIHNRYIIFATGITFQEFPL